MLSSVVAIFAVSICIALAAPPDITVKNLKLFVNGKEFIVQGFSYQPTPIGYASRKGLCSMRMTPWLNGVHIDRQLTCLTLDLDTVCVLRL